MRTVLPATKGVRLIGVTVSNFDRRPATTAEELPLFGVGEAASSETDPSCDNVE
jgi:hypothetical protein